MVRRQNSSETVWLLECLAIRLLLDLWACRFAYGSRCLPLCWASSIEALALIRPLYRKWDGNSDRDTPFGWGSGLLSHGIESVLQHQMSLAYENPLDDAFPKCIPPLIQILEGHACAISWIFIWPFFSVATPALQGLPNWSVSISVGWLFQEGI